MDEQASDFLRLVRPLGERLQAVARKYCARREDAADLVQETLLRAWRAFSPAGEPTHPRAWLFSIMRNTVIDWHRESTRRVSILPSAQEELTEIAGPGLDEPLTPLATMKEEEFREFLDAAVVRAFDALDTPSREVIMLSVAGELTYREIGEVLDCPIGTVMSRMARARSALRERLADFARSPQHRKEARR